MSYAVLRVAKIKTVQRANAATGHNYRQHPLANVDQLAPHPNREFVNVERKGYWSLLEARIKEADVKRVRVDSVRGMEMILTGSPEAFQRDEHGRTLDYWPALKVWSKNRIWPLRECEKRLTTPENGRFRVPTGWQLARPHIRQESNTQNRCTQSRYH